jgi:hypothetical protein
MNSNAKWTERNVVTPAPEWVPVANYREIVAIGCMDDADLAGEEGVTVQLRKATDGSGTNPANHGSAVTVLATGANDDIVAVAHAYSNALGATGGGVPYTHVSAVITAIGSPAATEAALGCVIRTGGRFNP